ncbi:MAG: hypothetical protein WCB21_11465 [Azonexus sp.]|jgi:hypothetical protein
MAGFENYGADTAEIELEMERKGIVLGVDWSDEVQVRALAREALDHLQEDITIAASGQLDYKLLAKVDLFGLAGIMLKTMEESASIGIMSHGGGAWKAFAKALWAEKEFRSSAGPTT